MKEELVWKTQSHGTRRAFLNPVTLEVYAIYRTSGIEWRYTLSRPITDHGIAMLHYIGKGTANTEEEAKQSAVVAARAFLHPVEIGA